MSYKILDIHSLVTTADLCDNFWDIIQTDVTNLPVDIYVDNEHCLPRHRGFWFRISKLKAVNLFSYIDITGSFYHDIRYFYLSERELQQICAFAIEYADLIDNLYTDRNNFSTGDFEYLLRYEYPFNSQSLNFKDILKESQNNKEQRFTELLSKLDPEDTGLSTVIWVDEGGTYVNTGHWKRIKFPNIPNSKNYRKGGTSSMDLDGNIITEENDDYDVPTNIEKDIKEFVKNNKYALGELEEQKITKAFFTDYCIPIDAENKEVLCEVFKNFVKWKKKYPNEEDSNFPQYDLIKDIKEEKDKLRKKKQLRKERRRRK